MGELVVRTLSQGLQAFLPVAFGLAWARRTGHLRAVTGVRAGLYASIPFTFAAGYLFQRTAYQARWEATLALLAVVIAVACTRLFSFLQTPDSRVRAFERRAAGLMTLLAAATVLLVVRQTMEIEVVLNIAGVQMRAVGPTLAIVIGVSAAFGAAWFWTVLAPRLPAGASASATRTFFVVFALQAAFYAFHEAAEAQFLPWSEVLHIATEPYGPDGVYGRYASLLLLAVPLVSALVHVAREGSSAQEGERRQPSLGWQSWSSTGLTAAGVIIPVICIALGVVESGDSAAARVEPSPAATPVPEIGALVAAPHLVFRHTGVDRSYGMLSMAPLNRSDAPPVTLGMPCERVAFAAGQGICLQADRGVFTTFKAVLFDEAFKARSAIKLDGSPSRTRVSADGRVGSITVFLTGHTYAVSAFSTKTILIDMGSGDVLGELEEFSTWRDGVRFRAADFNFWGVTFTRDSNIFYATLSTGGASYLIRGDLGLRKLTVLRRDLECPSLSPDGRRIAFKKRAGPAAGAWRLFVLDIATMAERPIAGETRYVDDQVEWLDDAHVLYAMPRPGSAVTDVWTAPVDGGEDARLFLREAESPIVVR